MALVLMFISFIMGVYCLEQEQIQNKAKTEALQRQKVSDKVSRVMRFYQYPIDDEIHQAIMNTFDPIFVSIIAAIESEYQHTAVSQKECRGLMQLSPDKLEDWQNKSENIRIGGEYLEAQYKRFGSYELAAAAYNAGPENVAKYAGIPPFEETQNYIDQLRRWYWYLEGTAGEVDIVKLTRGNIVRVARYREMVEQ